MLTPGCATFQYAGEVPEARGLPRSSGWPFEEQAYEESEPFDELRVSRGTEFVTRSRFWHSIRRTGCYGTQHVQL